jgi:tRNA(Ile)-lysidine synthase
MFAGVGADIYRRAEACILANGMDNMINRGVLIGLSGGADSVMLLCFLLEYRKRKTLDFPILAVHINHSIRGDEADSDEDFCHNLCDSLNVDYISKKIDVPQVAYDLGLGLEEAAREVRYLNFQHIILGREDLSTVAVAHNMSDNAETVLFHILRGSGSRGASGIRPVRDNIVRPLIDVSKSEILFALDQSNIPYVTDSTNLSGEYSRNYIRNEILPSLSKISSNPERMLARFADNMRFDDDFIFGVAKEFLATHKTVYNSDLRSLHYSVFIRVLSLMAGYEDGYLSSSLSNDIYALLDKDNFSYSLYSDVKFICERGVCTVGTGPCDVDYYIEVKGEVTAVEPYSAELILSKNKFSSNVYKKSIQVNLSSAIISGNLYLRPKKDGDTVYYGGMTHKVKKLFSDKKIPLSERKILPLLCDERGVIWVPGFGVRDDNPTTEERRDMFAILAMKE